MSAYDDLMAFQRRTEALAQVAGRLSWDQETVMPRGAADQRAEESAAIEAVLHARRTDPRLSEWLDSIDPAQLDDAGRAQLRLIRRDVARAARVPEALATEIARVTSRAQGQWAEARAADDFAAFAPVLERIVALKREEGAAIADSTAPGAVYDALLDGFEPGMTGAEVDAMFAAMRPRLVALRAACLEQPEPPGLSGHFDEAAQMRLARRLAEAFGYDMTRGRIDTAVHPFTSGGGADVRITTRTDALDPFNCLYSTIHEVGHGAYEQGIDAGHALTPGGAGGVDGRARKPEPHLREPDRARARLHRLAVRPHAREFRRSGGWRMPTPSTRG